MKNTLFFCFIINSFLSYCQKNNDKVRLITKDNVDYFYKHDNQGRVSELKKSDEVFFNYYSYLSDTAIVKQYIDFIDTTLAGIALLNENGLVKVGTKIYSNNLIVIENQYDENNQTLLQKISSDKLRSTIIFTNKNGNTIEQIAIDTIYENGKFKIQKRVVKSLFSDKLNPLQKNVIDDEFKGNGNKNLYSSITVEVLSSDFCDQLPCTFLPEKKQLVTLKYDYTFDENGRIKIETSTNIDTNEKSITKYYYY
jgi:hypothetical protein